MEGAVSAHLRSARISLGKPFSGESSNYYMLLGTTLFLVVLGLVMVLSSSSVEALSDGENSFTHFIKQGGFALIGIPAMLIVAHFPAHWWRKLAWPALGLAAIIQLLVFTPLGYGYGGNQNWISIGPSFSMQPSELVKLALVIWLGLVLSTKRELLKDWKHAVIPVAPVAVVAIGIVLFGKDLGTAIIMAAIVLGALFFAGVRLKHLAVGAGGAAIIGGLLSTASSSRQDRIGAWLNGCSEDYMNTCWQITHGTWALASGGIFGVGLGNSKAKWSWLPEADNDFIFAIIGEELGLVGAIVVLLLFIVLAVVFIRVITSNPDPFAKITCSAIMVWVIGQAFVNIAVILGVLPVLGVPLPLISSGGSALITTLVAIGIVLSFARSTPAPATPSRTRLGAVS